MECSDMVDEKNFEAEHLKDWRNKDIQNCKKKVEKLKNEHLDMIGIETKSGNCNENSCNVNNQNHLKKENMANNIGELNNGKDINIDNNIDEENMNECCKGKRKRCEMEYDNCSFKFQGSGLTCIGILPGLRSNIVSSDDSDQSCSSGSEDYNDNVKYDLLGRRLVFETKSSN